MRAAIEGLISSYSTENLNINMEDSGNTSGRPVTIFSGTYPGLLITNQGEALNICKIGMITLSASFNLSNFNFITGNPTCPDNCLLAIKDYLPACPTPNVQINVAGVSTGSNNPVILSEVGIVILGDTTQTEFINACKICLLYTSPSPRDS